MNLVHAFVHNPVKVAVGVLLVALFGTIALFRMPMQLTPEVETPTITVQTIWPGASPQEVEREIVQAQEEQLKGVEGVIKMSSESTDSMGTITLEFIAGTDMSKALLLVNTRLAQVREYPEDAQEPVLSTANSANTPIAWFILGPALPSDADIAAFERRHPDKAAGLAPMRRAQNAGLMLRRLRYAADADSVYRELLPPEIDITEMRKFAQDVIEARFERVPGVSNSNVFGGREEEVQVVFDPERLAARGLTVMHVRDALRGRNRDTSAGDFWEGKRRYVVRTIGQYRSLDEVADTLLSRRDGAPVYVRDVAEVRKGFKKPDGMVRNFGTSAIAVNCIRESGANVLEVMAGLRRAMAELNAGAVGQHRLMLKQVYDETEYIHSAVGLVQQNIVYGGLLTVVVLLLFLRSGRSTLVIGLAIPTSIIGTFLVMQLLGRSLNVISLAGLAFAIGMLVDNAVVVLENIFRRWQSGEPAFVAAIEGTREVWGAVVASTLTTLAVFIPVAFVKEESGQLFLDIALAISAGVGLSMLVSITVISTATARILPRRDEVPRPPPHVLVRALTLPYRAIAALVGGVLLRPLDLLGRAFVAAVVGTNAWLGRGLVRRLVVIGLLSWGAIDLTLRLLPKVEYLPTGNRNLVFGILLPPPGYNLDQMTAIGQRLEEDLRPYWDVDPGSPEAAKLPFPAIGDFFYVARGRQLFLGLRAADPLAAAGLVPLIRKVAMGIPGTFAIAKQSSLFEQGLSAGRSIDIEITGPDLPTLIGLGGQVLGQVMMTIPNAQAFPRPSLDLSSPEVHVRPLWDQAADLGMNARDLGYTVNALVDGAYATDYFVGGDKIDLTLLGQGRFSGRTQDIEALPVATATGDLVQLRALAEVTLASGPEQVNHRERERAITIQVSPPLEMALEDAMETIDRKIVQPLLASGRLTTEYRVGLSGTADKLRSTWLALRFNVVLALLITYLLMAALFESWTYPFVIILSVPLGAVGGVAGLWLLNRWVLQPLDVLTMLGFVILIGTVVNNPILIVHQALNHMREEGMPHGRAIVESVRTRIRPIFMTTLTTLMGLLPLVLFPGAGSELYRGLGSVLLGGLLVSTVFTLVLVPSLFGVTLETQAALYRLFGSRPPHQSPTPAPRPHEPVPAAESDR